MNINFYLKDPKSKSESNIILFFSYKGKRLKYYTGINVTAKQWSKAKQNIYSGVLNSEELNGQLRDLRNDLEKEYHHQVSNGIIPTVTYLKEFLSNRIKDESVEVENFYTIFENFKKVKSKVNTDGTMRKYAALQKHFVDIEKHYKIRLSVHSFTKGFYEKFVDYFIFVVKHVNSTIKEKHLKSLNTFINWLVDHEYIEKNVFKGIKFPYKVNPVDSIFLSEEELNILFKLDLTANKRLANVRDVFCIECYTGLRYSDTKKVQSHKINGRILEIHTQKTTDKIKVPLRQEALEILNQYFDNNLPLPVISNEKMNVYLKELGELAGFSNDYTILRISGKTKEEIIRKKYELISTHTGRRTFITLSYQRGMKPLDIMKITGHRSYDTFMKYYRLEEIDVSENFFNAWEEMKPQYKTSDIIKNFILKKVSLKTIAFSFGIEIDEIKKLVE